MDYLYTPYYCEENIWHLCEHAAFPFPTWVVFIFNPQREFAIWEQKLADPGRALIWDYHVIQVSLQNNSLRVYDFDTRLSWGIDFRRYLESAFPNFDYPDSLIPIFRFEKSDAFKKNFKSDRRHMKQEGVFLAPPPPWNMISEQSNLDLYLDINVKSEELFTLSELQHSNFVSRLSK